MSLVIRIIFFLNIAIELSLFAMEGREADVEIPRDPIIKEDPTEIYEEFVTKEVSLLIDYLDSAANTLRITLRASNPVLEAQIVSGKDKPKLINSSNSNLRFTENERKEKSLALVIIDLLAISSCISVYNSRLPEFFLPLKKTDSLSDLEKKLQVLTEFFISAILKKYKAGSSELHKNHLFFESLAKDKIDEAIQVLQELPKKALEKTKNYFVALSELSKNTNTSTPTKNQKKRQRKRKQKQALSSPQSGAEGSSTAQIDSLASNESVQIPSEPSDPHQQVEGAKEHEYSSEESEEEEGTSRDDFNRKLSRAKKACKNSIKFLASHGISLSNEQIIELSALSEAQKKSYCLNLLPMKSTKDSASKRSLQLSKNCIKKLKAILSNDGITFSEFQNFIERQLNGAVGSFGKGARIELYKVIDSENTTSFIRCIDFMRLRKNNSSGLVLAQPHFSFDRPHGGANGKESDKFYPELLRIVRMKLKNALQLTDDVLKDYLGFSHKELERLHLLDEQVAWAKTDKSAQ